MKLWLLVRPGQNRVGVILPVGGLPIVIHIQGKWGGDAGTFDKEY